jgi:DNA-binding NarL/FixJ family response regulator
MANTNELRALEDRLLRLEATVETLVRMLRREDQEPLVALAQEVKPAVTELMGYTPKQHAVMQMLCRGSGTEDMAKVLGVTPSTVKTHIRGIMRHANVRTRAQIVMSYGAIMASVSDGEYESFTGLPKDWAEHPDRYAAATKMLRVKAR